MASRKPWGRWLGVAGLTILLIGGAVNLTSRWHDSGVAYILFIVLAVLSLAFLAYRIAAGDAAEEFFNGRSTDAVREVVSFPDGKEQLHSRTELSEDEAIG